MLCDFSQNFKIVKDLTHYNLFYKQIYLWQCFDLMVTPFKCSSIDH